MNRLLKQMFWVCLCLFVLNGQAIADSFLDAFKNAVNASNSGNHAKAVKLFRPLAEQGHAAAQYLLGLEYYQGGNGVHQNYKEAAKWVRLAAEQGVDEAQSLLGSMYYKGKGVPQDYKEAAKSYQLAAEQSNVNAQQALGMMYQDGKGVPQDYTLAYMWLNIAEAQADNKEIASIFLKSVATHMTAQQIAEAQELTRKCTANKFKGC